MFRYISFNDSSNKARCDRPVNWDLRLDQNESLDRGTVTLKQTDENSWVRKCFRYPVQERSVNASKFSVKEPVMFIAWGERWGGGGGGGRGGGGGGGGGRNRRIWLSHCIIDLIPLKSMPFNPKILRPPPPPAPHSPPPPSTSGDNWWLVPCKSEVIDLGSFVNWEFSVLT